MRLILGLPVAAVITAALFLLMRFLILPDDDVKLDEIISASIDITRPQRDEDARSRDRNKPNRPEQQNAPPPPPPMQLETRVNPSNTNLNIAMPDFSGLNLSALGAPSDRSATPLVQVPPIYPDGAAQRGIEGWVLVEFDITPTGAVMNPRVIDADPQGVFDRAALRAIEKWKFKPQIVDGQPAPQFSKEYKITFQLEKE